MSIGIGKAAEKLDSSPDTLRYYEKIGLVQPARSSGGRRRFGQLDLDRLRFIRRAQSVGFSLDEIRQLLSLREDPVGCSSSVRKLAADKVREMHDRLETLRRMHDELALLVGLCTGESEHCPILDSLDSPEA